MIFTRQKVKLNGMNINSQHYLLPVWCSALAKRTCNRPITKSPEAVRLVYI